MASTAGPFSIPEPVRNLFSRFPLHTYPPISSPYQTPRITTPTLWIHPPLSTAPLGQSQSHAKHSQEVLSSDVECLKWQAYLALRHFSYPIAVRWDVSPDGGVDGRLPNLHVPLTGEETKAIDSEVKDDGEGELLAAHLIPEWVDRKLGELGPVEGYVDENARDESRAWVALLEGNVHAALLAFDPPPQTLLSLLTPYQSAGASRPISAVLPSPPAPLTGWTGLIRPYGVRLDLTSIELQYKDAIAALSDRLGTDRWFLGSAQPTALDALAFAYLHCILHARSETLRFEVSRRVNLVAWEQRVSREVRDAFRVYHGRRHYFGEITK
ncbi:hypothetical protein BDW22DRAFT_1358457 [Trametopsis cervina]|nr:hypothetical protein BDW22DRAFT_1358457 [Trametopsis cervina]